MVYKFIVGFILGVTDFYVIFKRKNLTGEMTGCSYRGPGLILSTYIAIDNHP